MSEYPDYVKRILEGEGLTPEHDEHIRRADAAYQEYLEMGGGTYTAADLFKDTDGEETSDRDE